MMKMNNVSRENLTTIHNAARIMFTYNVDAATDTGQYCLFTTTTQNFGTDLSKNHMLILKHILHKPYSYAAAGNPFQPPSMHDCLPLNQKQQYEEVQPCIFRLPHEKSNDSDNTTPVVSMTTERPAPS